MVRGWRYTNPSLANTPFRAARVRVCIMHPVQLMDSLRIFASYLSFLAFDFCFFFFVFFCWWFFCPFLLDVFAWFSLLCSRWSFEEVSLTFS